MLFKNKYERITVTDLNIAFDNWAVGYLIASNIKHLWYSKVFKSIQKCLFEEERERRIHSL